jgi:hypothetical protein
MNRRNIVSACTLMVAAVLTQVGTQPALAESKDKNTFSFDVAIDIKTLSLNNNDPANPKNPIRGSTFIVYGKIFPPGTIPPGITSFDPNQPGSIGTWVCRGVFLADYADIASGAAAIAFHTTQLWLFPTDDKMLVSEGLEGNVGVSTHRVVTGGTGAYGGAAGELLQQTIGVNQNGKGLFDIRFTFHIHTEGKD